MVKRQNKRQVESSVKDENLIEKRRNEMIHGAVKLFKLKGFHRTTTREIAKEAGFSIGTLYEYIRTKEDVLYLVCDNIYREVSLRLANLPTEEGTIAGLKASIRQYFLLIDSMSDEILVMYQESKSLPKDALRYVLTKELEMVGLFENLLAGCVQSGELSLSEKEINLIANDIVVQGQTWAFRRWAFRRNYTIDDYIDMQTTIFLNGILKK
ncbi:TetR/AcrR family transcriptional regulator [Viridibacillus arvi]|uniref:TetR/AcrR family transcriptional regulator n=1 Tax=Viridibacillus arvi TaxID=263475 RepID=UPI003D272D84